MNLLAEINAFLRKSHMPETRFGREAMKDPAFVHRLRLGTEPRAATVARVRAFISSRSDR